ncbi:hypothetical protein [aff. Roholtiella sp. LEGE 12411]|uniref:hypothetical protein n=1 Tax=aff. Roholtiella sp. LEGE 12411 TaxID=1828822 RepID=UPI001882D102|nr:hypothetical protein [aff. Roholtiella sp. LEGE 12411]MBE9038340.1 hypothetical protein [aff. Roholtiella sp. LEGE 12411]
MMTINIAVAKSNQERAAAYRARQKQGIEIPLCKCDRPLKGKLSQRRRLCQLCFLNSEDGKHRAWKRVNAKRGRNVLQQYLPSWGNWKVGDKAIAPDGSEGVVGAIALYVNSSVEATVQFTEEVGELLEESFLISSISCLININA